VHASRWPAATSPASTSRTRSHRAAPGWGRTTRSTTRTLRLLADKQQNWDTLDAIRDIASSIGATPSQVALSWVTNRPSATAPITAASNLAQLEENLAGADLELERGRHKRLDDVSAQPPTTTPTGPSARSSRSCYVDSSEQVIRELTWEFPSRR
jgi:aryl-alcohol dehydrogenase-like predicted oxidoreductase